MPVHHGTAEKAAAGRRLVFDPQGGAGDRPAALLQGMQGQVENRAGHKRSLDWVGLAAVEVLLDMPGKRVEEASAGRLGEVEEAANWLFLVLEAAREAEFGDGFDQVEDRATGSVGIFNQNRQRLQDVLADGT